MNSTLSPETPEKIPPRLVTPDARLLTLALPPQTMPTR
jgi:hypothetical protein